MKNFEITKTGKETLEVFPLSVKAKKIFNESLMGGGVVSLEIEEQYLNAFLETMQEKMDLLDDDEDRIVEVDDEDEDEDEDEEGEHLDMNGDDAMADACFDNCHG